MAPKWPQVNIGPEHINEHTTYLKEACTQLQAVNRGRQNQVPWNTVQHYLTSTIALIGKVLRQPSMSDILQQVQDAAKCTQTIQKDVKIIKNSVGLSTTPLVASNFSGRQTAAISWAQVAAQAKGSPPAPPPTQHGADTSRTSHTITTYTDRALTVKLKDHGIAQRHRTQSAAWTKQQVQNSVRDNSPTNSIKIVAAYQLKSGEIQIFTSTTAEATQLKENQGWLKGLGERAELIMPTYGVIVHGISTNSINTKDQTATIQQMLADNYTVIPSAEITYVGWLTKEATPKQASSIVVEFKDPEMANTIIYAGMVWEGQVHQCQLYDRACRVKQCFRCCNYGHIGTQCNASQTCGYCAGQHETRHCKQKGTEGFTAQCAQRLPSEEEGDGTVERAKQARSIYWHVPPKEKATRQSTRGKHNTNATPMIRTQTAPDATRTITQRLAETMRPIQEASTPVHVEQTPRPEQPTDQAITQAAPQTSTSPTPQVPEDEPMVQPPVAPPAEENRQTPATRQESPILQQPGSQNAIGGSGRDHPQPSTNQMDETEGLLTLQETDDWLNNMLGDNGNGWIYDTAEVEPSPITSLATDTRTALGRIYKGCHCPEHQEIYSDWPAHNAELTIVQCMKICVYCGKDFAVAAELRKHMRKHHCASQNLRIRVETTGRGSSKTPAWIVRDPAEIPNCSWLEPRYSPMMRRH
ncbi:conserved hypothetical protein [Talaromyces stipitatus ATCC 10500]|uniref:C2H2-type domain-containing protein n=1 Tax=Talaromyces stipitatus (strain ATCC 10500 / CBS 375.48 / QM 6759 / NRRL 1006) TaxID=441959 RepID=B8MSW8_TALSN|nr:uncharacterized protein TSTA_000990 [Talaromyces stipitatus ATCC 10500]EED12027.1 conserved hypothetical protein [Talaromyces stipitatus ATCC 10500]